MQMIKIYLNVYDFCGGNCCLQAIGLGAYHTGIQINDQQYCFCVVSTDPTEIGIISFQPQTADYKFNRKIYLGQTQIMPYKFNQILRQLQQDFTVGKYHMFNNNCNHFSNELSKKLLNIEIPQWIFRSTNLLSYLCCCIPTRWANGQTILEYLIEQQEKKAEEKQLIKY